MGTLRANVLKYPGSYGLNTIDTTLSDENSRFGAQALNAVVDSGGKFTARKDFVNQTSGFSAIVRSLFSHQNNDATETILSAAEGVVYSGISTLTSRYDYRAGSQFVDVGGAKSNATSTGLANDATTYGILISINGGADQQINVTGSSAQTYSNLITAINADIAGGATCTLTGGNLKFTSASNGVGSAISLTNSAGAASVALLSTLTNFVAIRQASPGTASHENWQYASLSQRLFLAQKDQHFTVLNESTFAVESIVGQPWTHQPNCALSAYGRVWTADDENGGVRSTIWWSNLLDGKTWNSGDAGSLNLTNAWPKGQDSIVALAAAFNRLIVFGRKSILMYALPTDNNPATMTLEDVIEDLGCVSRDSVRATDQGVYFLSDNGVYRLDKLVHTTSLLSAPQISVLYNEDLLADIAGETPSLIRTGYYPKEGYLTFSFPTRNRTYCINTRKNVPELNKPIATVWNNVGRPFYAFAYSSGTGEWYSGGQNGIHKYSGYTPDGASNAYNLVWTGQWLPFGNESAQKHAKAVSVVLDAASGQTGTFEWKVDYQENTARSNAITCSALEFGENPGLGTVNTQVGGSFKVIQPSLSFPINGNTVTLHQVRIYANPGAVKIG